MNLWKWAYELFTRASVWLQYLRCPCRGSRPGRRGSGCGTSGSGRSARRRRASCGSPETTPPSAPDRSARCGRRTSCGALSTRSINFIDTNRNKKKFLFIYTADKSQQSPVPPVTVLHKSHVHLIIRLTQSSAGEDTWLSQTLYLITPTHPQTAVLCL